MTALLCNLITLFYFAVIARILLSWFPISPGSGMATAFSFLYSITEPVMGPVRRIVPPLGAFDLSPIVVILGLQILRGAFLGCSVTGLL